MNETRDGGINLEQLKPRKIRCRRCTENKSVNHYKEEPDICNDCIAKRDTEIKLYNYRNKGMIQIPHLEGLSIKQIIGALSKFTIPYIEDIIHKKSAVFILESDYESFISGLIQNVLKINPNEIETLKLDNQKIVEELKELKKKMKDAESEFKSNIKALEIKHEAEIKELLKNKNKSSKTQAERMADTQIDDPEHADKNEIEISINNQDAKISDPLEQ